METVLDDVRDEYAETTKERFAHYIGNRRRTGDYGLQTLHPLGRHPDDWWEVQPIAPSAKERTGFPTQKPLALYERIIRASSNEGDLVLDPFAGCATTPVAAERLGRHWVGMDIWDGAIAQVRRRMADSRQLLTDANPQVVYSTEPPERTDEVDETVPDLVLRPQRVKSRWERLSHAEMRDILALAQASGDTVICAGCGIQLPVRYMELDHREPRKDGGENVITNRILLCGPRNRTKSANLTMSGKARDAADRCRVEMV